MSYKSIIEKFENYTDCKDTGVKCSSKVDEEGNCSLFFRGVKVAFKTKEGRLFVSINSHSLMGSPRFYRFWFVLAHKYRNAIPYIWDVDVLNKGREGSWDGSWLEIIQFPDSKTYAKVKYEGE